MDENTMKFNKFEKLFFRINLGILTLSAALYALFAAVIEDLGPFVDLIINFIEFIADSVFSLSESFNFNKIVDCISVLINNGFIKYDDPYNGFKYIDPNEVDTIYYIHYYSSKIKVNVLIKRTNINEYI